MIHYSVKEQEDAHMHLSNFIALEYTVIKLHYFSKRAVHEACNTFGLDVIVRGHQVVMDGYEFFADRKLVTVFSAPNYCGEFNNK